MNCTCQDATRHWPFHGFISIGEESEREHWPKSQKQERNEKMGLGSLAGASGGEGGWCCRPGAVHRSFVLLLLSFWSHFRLLPCGLQTSQSAAGSISGIIFRHCCCSSSSSSWTYNNIHILKEICNKNYLINLWIYLFIFVLIMNYFCVRMWVCICKSAICVVLCLWQKFIFL